MQIGINQFLHHDFYLFGMTQKITRLIRVFLSHRGGATAIEYGLIAALVFVGMVSAVQQFAGNSVDMWNMIASKMK